MWLHYSRLASICAVVLLHVAAIVILQAPYGSQDWWIANIYNSLSRWCVPVFVMISGALLLDPAQKLPLSVFYKKRATRIFIPTVFWSGVFLAWTAMKIYVKSGEFVVTPLVANLIAGEPYYHLWFLYMLSFLYLFTPFLQRMVERLSQRELVVLVVASMSLAALNSLIGSFGGSQPLFFNKFLYYTPYFFLGYLIRITEVPVKATNAIAFFLFCVLFTALGYYYSQRFDNSYFYNYLGIPVIAMSCSLMMFFKNYRWRDGASVGAVAGFSFGIYLVHPLFLEVIDYAGLGPLSYSPLISIPITTFSVLILSALLAWFLSFIPILKRTV